RSAGRRRSPARRSGPPAARCGGPARPGRASSGSDAPGHPPGRRSGLSFRRARARRPGTWGTAGGSRCPLPHSSGTATRTRTGRTWSGRRAAAEEGAQSARAAEVAPENVERLGEAEVCDAEPAARRARPAHARHAVPIVRGALLGITQHFVRLRDLLELLFGRRLLLGSD